MGFIAAFYEERIYGMLRKKLIGQTAKATPFAQVPYTPMINCVLARAGASFETARLNAVRRLRAGATKSMPAKTCASDYTERGRRERLDIVTMFFQIPSKQSTTINQFAT